MKAEQGIRELLKSIGEDPNREGLIETPLRVVKAFKELTEGYSKDAGEILSKQFSSTYSGIVLLKNIDFVSVCEHHLLPFTGKAHVAYIPSTGKVVGLSKLARLVEMYGRRLQLQEQMTDQIADAMEKHLQPLAVAVVVEAGHSCMACRGIKKANATMVTSALRGSFRDEPEPRAEVMKLIYG